MSKTCKLPLSKKEPHRIHEAHVIKLVFYLPSYGP